jgi:hypothetical protein
MILDCLIYTMIFAGAAQATLGQRFPGNSGKGMSIGVGFALAISLVLFENKRGVNLQAFGPVACLIIVVILGLMVYRLFRWAGISVLASGAWGTVMAAFAGMLLVPGASDSEGAIAPAFQALAVIAAIILFIVVLGPSFKATGYGRKGTIPGMTGGASSRPHARAARFEEKALDARIRPIARLTVKDSKDLLRDLKALKWSIGKTGMDPRARAMLLSQFGNILPRDHALSIRIDELKKLNEGLLQLDGSLLSENLKTRVQSLNESEKVLLKKEMKDEAARLGIEKRILGLEDDIRSRINQVAALIQEAARFLEQGMVKSSVDAVVQAIQAERKARRLSKELAALEDLLLRLAKRDLWFEKGLKAGTP